MASALKNLSSYDEKNLPSASSLNFGIVVSDWNQEITHALYQGCYDTLIKHGVKAVSYTHLTLPTICSV